MTQHIVASYENELRELGRKIAEMGGQVERLVADSTIALLKRDVTLAEKVIIGDRKVNALQREIEDAAITMIALRQPIASDLREVISSIRVAIDLEDRKSVV